MGISFRVRAEPALGCRHDQETTPVFEMHEAPARIPRATVGYSRGADTIPGMGRPDYSFLRRPRWIAGHLVALVAVVAFVNLGLWQLDRLEQRREYNDLVTARLAAPPVTADDLAGADPDDVEYRRVVLTGEYVAADEVVLRARSRRGVSGNEVLTPLRTSPGTAVMVDRGWVPIDVEGPPVVGAEPPGGAVTVTGIVRRGDEPGGLGPKDPAEGRLDRVSRIDVARLDAQTSDALLPVWVQLESQDPGSATEFPLPVDLPELGEGPHLSYAGQWFIFAGIVLVGYPVLLRRTAARPGEGAGGNRPSAGRDR
jgi:surfeit locus 1 family protein